MAGTFLVLGEKKNPSLLTDHSVYAKNSPLSLTQDKFVSMLSTVYEQKVVSK